MYTKLKTGVCFNYYGEATAITSPKNNTLILNNTTTDIPNMKYGCFQIACEVDDPHNKLDTDIYILLLNENRLLVDESNVLFYNNLSSKNKSVELAGDRMGCPFPPDDEAYINFEMIDENVTSILFLYGHYCGEDRTKEYLSKLRALRIRIALSNDFNDLYSENKTFLQYDIEKYPTDSTLLQIGLMYKESGTWHFDNSISGYTAKNVEYQLLEICEKYGLKIN